MSLLLLLLDGSYSGVNPIIDTCWIPGTRRAWLGRCYGGRLLARARCAVRIARVVIPAA